MTKISCKQVEYNIEEETMNNENGKVVDEVCEEVYEEVKKLITWLGHSNHNPNNLLMNSDEIISELTMEVVVGVNHYHYLDKDQILKLIKTMLSNRLGELKYKYYLTHRSESKNDVSVESEMLSDFYASEESVEDEVIRRMTILSMREKLSDSAKLVFDAVVYGSSRLDIFVDLANLRNKCMVTEDTDDFKVTNRYSTKMLSQALLMSTRRVKSAIKEIRVMMENV